MLYAFLLILLFSTNQVQSKIYPIQFSISEEKIVKEIPRKNRDFAFIVPQRLETYIYNEEEAYYKDYQRSYFAITTKKSGWDCMRHYEILANGCIPYFIDLEKCDADTMYFLPKGLILEAMHLPGVSLLSIDHTKFDISKYTEILNKLLDHTRNYLTLKKMASYLLNSINYSGNGRILFLSNDPHPDYLRCCMLAGLKQLLGDRIVDIPKIDHIYKNYSGDIKQLYGKGMSYTKLVDDLSIGRENIEQRIIDREFDLIIYGSVHRGLRFHDLVRQTYPEDKIIYLCGDDYHHCEYVNLPHLFLREFEARHP